MASPLRLQGIECVSLFYFALLTGILNTTMRLLIFLLLLVGSGGLYSQKDSVEIRCKVQGLKSGTVKLISVFGDQNLFVDSTFSNEQGEFEWIRKKPYHPGYYYLILPDYTNFHMILDSDQDFSMHTTKEDLIGNMRIQGSIDNQLLYETLKLQLRHEFAMDSLNAMRNAKANDSVALKKYDVEVKKIIDEKKNQLDGFIKKYPNVFFVKFKRAGQNPDLVDVRKANGEIDRDRQLELFRQAYWDNVDLSDKRLLYTPVLVNKLKKFIVELTPQHPDSIIRQADFIIKKSLANKEIFQFVSNWIALNYEPTKTKVMDGEAVFVHILDKYFTKENAFWMDDKELAAIKKKVYEMQSSCLGCQGQDIVSTDLNGATRSIYELKEDFVIVYMYDPDCDHCQKETPQLVQFYKEWKSKGVEVFAVVLNSTDQKWRDFVKKYQTDLWINVHDPTNRSIYAKYFVDITPEIYVLNKERKIIGKNLKPDQIKLIIEKELASKSK